MGRIKKVGLVMKNYRVFVPKDPKYVLILELDC